MTTVGVVTGAASGMGRACLERLRGTFRTLVHAAGISPTMGDARTIVDVNLVGTTRILDRAALLLPDTGMASSYSKVGVQLEARKAAVRWAPLGGRVVSPLMRDMLDAQPMSRLGDSDEIAVVVAFLCSDAASFVSGVDVLVDGTEQAKQMTSAPA